MLQNLICQERPGEEPALCHVDSGLEEVKAAGSAFQSAVMTDANTSLVTVAEINDTYE